MSVGNVVIHVSLQCLVKLKMTTYHLMFSDVSRECGHSGKSAMSGETENDNIPFNVQWWQ